MDKAITISSDESEEGMDVTSSFNSSQSEEFLLRMDWILKYIENLEQWKNENIGKRFHKKYS